MDFFEKLLALKESRRFWAAVGGVLTVVLSDAFGLTEQQTTAIVGLIISWIVGDSITKTSRAQRATRSSGL